MIIKQQRFRLALLAFFFVLFVFLILDLSRKPLQGLYLLKFIAILPFLALFVMDVFYEKKLYTLKASAILTDRNFRPTLINITLIFTIFLYNNTLNAGSLCFMALIIISCLMRKAQKDLLFINESGFFKKDLFDMSSVRWREVDKIEYIGNLVVIAWPGDILRIDLSKMNDADKESLIQKMSIYMEMPYHN